MFGFSAGVPTAAAAAAGGAAPGAALSRAGRLLCLEQQDAPWSVGCCGCGAGHMDGHTVMLMVTVVVLLVLGKHTNTAAKVRSVNICVFNVCYCDLNS